MSFSRTLTSWVDANEETLKTFGRYTVQATNDDRSKPSAHVAVDVEDGSVEMIVWDSGEVEFSYGSGGSFTDEHHEIATVEELHQLLATMVERARGLQHPSG